MTSPFETSYVVVQNDKVVEHINASSAKEAQDKQTQTGKLYVEVGK